MLTHKDQLAIFTLIGQLLTKDVRCHAFGGTAMMFYGYKDETKDVDLLFETLEEREEFITVLKKIGFNETGLLNIYVPEKLRDLHKPLMFKRSSDEFRFDLFVKKVFKTLLSPKMQEDKFASHEFHTTNTLTVQVLRKEHLVLLKSVTSRDRDFTDILSIVQEEKDFDWQYLLDEVAWQYERGDGWVVLDMEKTLRELQKYIFVPEKYFGQLAKMLDKGKKKG